MEQKDISVILDRLLDRCLQIAAKKIVEPLKLIKKLRILLANSTEQNPCGKICSCRSAVLDKSRIMVLLHSTMM